MFNAMYLLHPYAREPDQPVPALVLGLQIIREFAGRIGDDFEPLLFDVLVLERRLIQRFAHLGMNRMRDLAWHTRRSSEREPGARVVARHTRLTHGRQIRQARDALARRGG